MPRHEQKLDQDLIAARQQLIEQLKDSRLRVAEAETDDGQGRADSLRRKTRSVG
jgi:hypothetical protein